MTIQTELEHVFSRFHMLRHLMRGTLKQATDELWAEILCELEIQKTGAKQCLTAKE